LAESNNTHLDVNTLKIIKHMLEDTMQENKAIRSLLEKRHRRLRGMWVKLQDLV
jgi:hypothetical protein